MTQQNHGPAVSASGLRKSFGDKVVLDGIGLAIAEGTIFALLGPNGAGKTTTVQILSTLIPADAGEMRVAGHDVRAEPDLVRAAIGVTGQFSAVDNLLTGTENLLLMADLAHLDRREGRRRAAELLETFELTGAAGKPAMTFSGGMRRRLDLAMTLMLRPRILFLDEPTTGLDPRSRNEIWTIVRELVREGTTLLLTTQYLEEADELADRIAVIDHGRVIAEGTGNELKERIGGQILEVELASAARRDEAQAVLRGVGCGDPEPEARPDRLTMPAPRDGLELVEDAAAALRHAQIDVSNLGLRGPTLDDVFLQLTGAPASEDGQPASADGQPQSSTPAAPAAVVQPVPSKAPAPEREPERPARRLLRLHVPTPAEVRSALTDTRVVTGRNLRHFVRQPQLLIFSTIQPIMFVLLFAYVFGGAVKGALPHGVKYIDFLLPGIFVQSVAFRATQTAVGLSEDLERGVVDRFRSMPMARSAVLVGRTVADLVRNVLIIGLMTVVGYLIGFSFHAGVLNALACVAVVSVFGLALSWIFAFVALTVRGAEAAQSAGFVVIFPLVFASSVFVPISSMPDWLQAFAKVSPVTLTANAARTYALDGGVPGSLGGAAAWILAVLAIFIPLCVWRYRRMS